MRLKIKQVWPAMMVAFLIAGCSKPVETTAPTAALTAAAPTQATAPAADPNANVDLDQMTRDLRRWILKNQRPPKDFADFAATAGSLIPAAPAGKKFAISKEMRVVLVNR
jgi:hypothetical protein